MSEVRVSLFEALQEYDPSFNQQKLVYVVFGVTGLLSFVFSILLITFSSGWRDESQALLNQTYHQVFTLYTFDVLLLNFIQCFLVSGEVILCGEWNDSVPYRISYMIWKLSR